MTAKAGTARRKTAKGKALRIIARIPAIIVGIFLLLPTTPGPHADLLDMAQRLVGGTMLAGAGTWLLWMLRMALAKGDGKTDRSTRAILLILCSTSIMGGVILATLPVIDWATGPETGRVNIISVQTRRHGARTHFTRTEATIRTPDGKETTITTDTAGDDWLNAAKDGKPVSWWNQCHIAKP